jgi:hypothetical protein
LNFCHQSRLFHLKLTWRTSNFMQSVIYEKFVCGKDGTWADSHECLCLMGRARE